MKRIYFSPEEAREGARRKEREWRKRNRELLNARKREARRMQRQVKPHVHEHPMRPPIEVLRQRELERERVSQLELTPNMAILGDPPPWRSALHQRGERLS